MTSTLRSICLACSLLLALATASAQTPVRRNAPQQVQPAQPASPDRVRGVQYVQSDTTARPPIRTLQGFLVGVDVVGAVMYGVADYGQLEGMLRINLAERWFPTLEAGLGRSDATNEDTGLHFKTSAPYLRVGADYNFCKNLYSGNRIYGGLRVGYAKQKYDLDGPGVHDALTGLTADYRFSDLQASCVWTELVFGLEAKMWDAFHVGWTVRYRKRLNQHFDEPGQPWYVPGFGKNSGHTFGATFNLIIDL